MDTIIKEIYQGILDGQHKAVEAKVQAAVQAGVNPKALLDEGMIAAMAEVGRLFEAGEYYVPEMLVSARAMQTGLAILKPHLKEANVKPAGRVAIGTVKGDLHDIGKNLVAMMLEGAGFEIVDLGTDVTPEKFAEAARDVNLVALSALLTTTMPNMKLIIEAVRTVDASRKVKVMIGGAPVTEAFAQQVGADGYAPDASRAVAVARSLMG